MIVASDWASGNDVQIAFYCIRIANIIIFEGEKRTNFEGTKTYFHKVIELFARRYSELKNFSSFDFWEVYYKHYNYFEENNNIVKGSENQSAIQQKLVEFLSTAKITKSYSVTKLMIRALALAEIIKSMACIKVDITTITSICLQITEKYKMDQKIAYWVINEIEDEFVLNSYLDDETKDLNFDSSIQLKVPSKNILEIWFTLVIAFLLPTDTLKFITSSKAHYSTLHKILLKNTCLSKSFDMSTRRDIWLLMMDQESKAKSFRSSTSEEGDMQIIKMDLNRSVELFNQADYDVGSHSYI